MGWGYEGGAGAGTKRTLTDSHGFRSLNNPRGKKVCYDSVTRKERLCALSTLVSTLSINSLVV